ncbi:HlyD family efflux transporter periplasmic adaptor subunit [Paracoccus liaowanqingii]|uniref:HlyD family efflux transporter periplasmic adaptor subunit n=1 Tax=Paracoccus liaowanqingii TaxID=2560053 RepID=A0A4P7HPR4_9RHOB|nr:HlyD family efflux transporter periplasmic adaptor subunit [Paracoccus liaowanqingii]QBX35723.1 HlyD family efflux transporter periplasmic adaptor subunit [Paracoccus liaowanqingii]
MRFLTRSLLGLFLTFLTLALLFLAGFQLWQAAAMRGAGGGPARTAEEQVYATRLVTLTPGTVAPVLQVFGQVRTLRELQLRAGASGRIVQLDAALQEGGVVVAGQLLARIDPAAAQAALDISQAERDDAQATLADVRRRVDIAGEDLAAAERQAELREAAVTRQGQLAERGLGTSLDRETAELAASTAQQTVIAARAAQADALSAVTAAENALRRAEIALTEARRALADTEIRAGFDGRVTAVTAVEGGLVSLNEQLATIIDPEALEVQMPLSLDQFARLAGPDGALLPQEVTLLLDGSAGQRAARARLDRAAASVAEGSTGRIVYARLTEGGGALRPGDFVTARIAEPALEGAAILPATALGAQGEVLVAGADGRLAAMAVTVLRRQGDDLVVAVPPALAGARIVAERAPQLGIGIRVRDVTETPNPPPGPMEGPEQRVERPEGASRG